MSEDKKPFTVTDRRHFSAEGEPHPEPPEVPAAAAPAEDAPADTDVDVAEGPIPTDFPGLVVMLASQASALMTGGPDGGAPDMEASRAFIDLLQMLQEKTKGNRTPQEDRLLEEILYQLRMAFVARTRGGA